MIKKRSPKRVSPYPLLFSALCVCTTLPAVAEAPATPKPFPELTFHAAPRPLATGAITDDWPRLLGPNHNATTRETNLLKQWPATGPALVWEMKTGEGFAAPAVLGDRLVFFHRIENEVRVECLHPETGRRYWQFSYTSNYRDRYGFNNGPRAGPVLDGNRVYLHGVEGILHCLDLDTGKIIWKRDTSTEFKVPQDYFGVVSTPLVEGNLLIVNVGAPGGPCVVAFDKRTGKIVWKAGTQWGPSCASPIPAVVHGERRIFVFAGGDSRPPTGGLLCIDPADGRIRSRHPFRSKRYESVNASSPVIVGDRAFISTSYKTGGVLLGMSDKGQFDVAWTTDAFGAHFTTPIYYEDCLFGFNGMNRRELALVCLDWKTGKRRWREQPELVETVMVKGETQSVPYSLDNGSLIHADGAFLCLGQQGHLLWLNLSPGGYQEIARTRLFSADQTWTMPALSRGLLYVNQNQRDTIHKTPPRLLCYDLRGGGMMNGE